jgi:hypothetical protein
VWTLSIAVAISALSLHAAEQTGKLTVQWPVPLSQQLTESSLLSDVLDRLLTTK